MVAAIGLSVSPSCTVLHARDLKKGRVLGTRVVPRSRTTGLEPGEAAAQDWLSGLIGLLDGMPIDDVSVLSLAGPMHSLVALDAGSAVIRPALLAEDQRSAPDAGWCNKKIPALDWSTSVGSVPSAALTVTKLSWLHRSEPDNWERIARLCPLGTYLSAGLCDTAGGYATDAVTASGTGYWSPGAQAYDDRVLSLIDGERDWSGVLPAVVGPLDTIGARGTARVGVGTSDLMAMALALGAEQGDVIVSVGVRVVVFGFSPRAIVDESGAMSSFASLLGGFRVAAEIPMDSDETSAGVIAAIRTLRNAGVPTGGRLFVCGEEHDVIDIALRCSRAEGSRVQVCTDDELGAVGASRHAAAIALAEWPAWQPVVTRRV